MSWEMFSMIGTIAFAISGAVVAMEEDYDVLGVFVLGLVTAFGGGVMRNVLIGLPVSAIWQQESAFIIAIAAILIVFLLPLKWIYRWRSGEALFDAVGLSAFAIQGALYAKEIAHPLGAVIVAAMLTGIGGGIIRDLLAGRKPLVLQDEIYAVWAIMAGICIGTGVIYEQIGLYSLFVAVIGLRMLSVIRKWKLPRRSLKEAHTNSWKGKKSE